MNAKMRVLIGVSVMMFVLIKSSYGYAAYTPYDLWDRCSRSLTLDCPYRYNGRAGTFRCLLVTLLDPGLCQLNVTLQTNCGISYNNYSIYLNIRKFDVPTNDRLRIYESNSNSRTLLKDLTGYQPALSNPASVAQTRTSYVRQPSISIEYFRSTSDATSPHEFFIDYVILEDTASADNTYCSALSGYVHDDYICDKDDSTDRVNCPSSFTFDTGRNPAYSRQLCNNTDNDDHRVFDDGMSAGVIAGISIGCAFAFAIVLYTITVAVRKLAAARRAAPVVLAPETITSTRPVVVGTYEPMPSYAEAVATTTTNPPQPPARY
ncbi:uncharacterized protein LOC129596466 [Paramacrobiotus metropolitanus]|uniref:uncharacterized protein LOC129596466 n=1 Tax=Paramacrobiotus metropolitanus TaxID=2943436 RepID=UPI002445F1FF|nr:uncharacterized protein LOC129596466 [Paramacrobiotus metropolitanus]